jgi:hypothetical protein
LLCVSLSSLAGEVVTNDTGEEATGLRIVFSTPVQITAFGDTLMEVDQTGTADEFVFSGGTVSPWESHWLNWAPSSAQIISYEWLSDLSISSPISIVAVEADYPEYCGLLVAPHGISKVWVDQLPEDFFNLVCRTNSNWLGIMFTITVGSSLDSTVEIYGCESDRVPGDNGRSFTDEELVALIRRAKEQDLRIFLLPELVGLAGDPVEEGGLGVPLRGVGDPQAYAWLMNNEGKGERVDLWPWHPDHPDHDRFVAEFFETYGDCLVHYAIIAEQEGVELFGLGTETDYLFITRTSQMPPGPETSAEYLNELREVVARIREVYSGDITFDMDGSDLWDPYMQGLAEMWGDLGLDVIGISTHFPLLDEKPQGIPSVDVLADAWERIFESKLISLANLYPDKPLIFTEFGYNAYPGSSHYAGEGGFLPNVLIDTNRNGLDDGVEEQSNIYEALFRTLEKLPGVVDGMFMFGDMIAPDFAWEQTFGKLRSGALRHTPVEELVAGYYALYTGNECIPDKSATAVQEHLAMQFDHESEIAYFCNGPKDLSTARNWGLNGSRVRGVIVEVEDSTFRCGIVLDEADQFGPYGYLLRFIPQTAATLDIYFDPWSGDVYFRRNEQEFDLASAVSIAISKTKFEMSLDLSSLLDELGISLEAFLTSEITLTLDYGDNICTEFFEFPGPGNIMQVEAHSS